MKSAETTDSHAALVERAAHAGWGGFLTLALWLWIGWPAALVVLAGALAKEALESLGWAWWEPRQSWASSAVDVLFFLAGILPAALLHFWWFQP